MKQGNIAMIMLALLLVGAAPAWAGNAPPPPDPTQDRLLLTAGFLGSHPDLRFRLLGLEKREADKQPEAFKFFQRAAFYADKPSQAMVAEMLWNGIGVQQDRALAYAWMDLAAERGYAGFLELRERYWQPLSDIERARAVEVGQDVYATYGDAAAQPRIARYLRQGRRNVTGSRTGFTGALRIIVPGPAGPEEIDGSTFYDERYWDPVKYQAWHDTIWMKPRVGSVHVGAAEQISTEQSRIPYAAPVPDGDAPPMDDTMPSVDQPSDGR